MMTMMMMLMYLGLAGLELAEGLHAVHLVQPGAELRHRDGRSLQEVHQVACHALALHPTHPPTTRQIGKQAQEECL